MPLPDDPSTSSGRTGDHAERVLDLVALVPPGRATTYGDLAELLGRGSGRTVGAVMARQGRALAWWRVLRSDGTPPPHLAAEALRRLAAEGCPLRRGGRAVELAACRWEGPAR